MMKKLKIYLDTSVINFLFADDAPEKKEIAIDFFENYINDFDVYISDVVLNEIDKTTNLERKNALLDIIKKYPIKFLENIDSDEIINLAKEYIENGILPKKSEIDALHVAISTVNQIDILLSWNYKHLANFNRKKKIQLINLQNNFNYPFDILTPMEVLDDKNSQ